MQRRNFLLATAATLPALLIGTTGKAQPIRAKKGIMVKATESRFGEKTVLGGKSPNDIKVSQKDTNGELTVLEYSGNEKGGPPLHVHPFQDEVFFILAGEYLFQVGEEQHNLKAGDTIFLPRNVPHAFAQITEAGKAVFLFQPSGKMEDFFRQAAGFAGSPTPEQGTKLFADHDITIVGPPLPF